MRKIVNPCKVRIGKTFAPVFCAIEVKEGRLSISGVVGPLSSGNARGGCGQIDMKFKHQNPAHDDARYSDLFGREAGNMKLETRWTWDNWYKLLEVWKIWHLNDMQAGCEHQQAEGWGNKDLTIAHYKLLPEVSAKQDELEQNIKASIGQNGKAELTPKEQAIYNLPYFLEIPAGEGYPAPAEVLKNYKLDKTKSKTSGWLHQEQHPEGVLSKPCPVCGYKYGTEWRKKELPAEIVDFLQGLPETTKKPAWV